MGIYRTIHLNSLWNTEFRISFKTDTKIRMFLNYVLQSVWQTFDQTYRNDKSRKVYEASVFMLASSATISIEYNQ